MKSRGRRTQRRAEERAAENRKREAARRQLQPMQVPESIKALGEADRGR